METEISPWNGVCAFHLLKISNIKPEKEYTN